MPEISIPDILPYLLALLGLLLVWEVHAVAVRAGRIKAVDIWNRSGIRMFLHVTPEDSYACEVCREAGGRVFLPAVVATKGFTPQATLCTNPAGCRCVMVGLYGAWPAAERLRLQVRTHAGRFRMSSEGIGDLIAGARARNVGATVVDRLSLCMLEAMRAEGTEPDVAIERYRFLLEHATEDRDLGFVVPAYLRLSDLLEREGRRGEALRVVDRFFKAYGEKGRRNGSYRPTAAQLEMMSLRKTRLMSVVAR